MFIGAMRKAPTLAPEPSLAEFNLDDMVKTSFDTNSGRWIQESTQALAQNTTPDPQTVPEALIDEDFTAVGQHWNFVPSHDSGDMMDVCRSSMDSLRESELNFDGIDLSIPFTAETAHRGVTGSYPSLPELPTSLGTQFELLDDLSANVRDNPPPHTQYESLGLPPTPSYGPQYPDLEMFGTPFSTTPALTSAATTPSRQQGPRGAQRDTSTDAHLVQLRGEGKSYKQIKDMLGLEEAESTLRGRYRTLTKPKEARVRKPDWTQESVSAGTSAEDEYLLISVLK